MKISILLPYKENFSPIYAGAVSLFVKDTTKISKYKKYITVYGNTNLKNIYNLSYKNIFLKKNLIESGSKLYVNKFLSYENDNPSDIIEIHNRPNYFHLIYHKKKNQKMILYFHNDPLSMRWSSTSLRASVRAFWNCSPRRGYFAISIPMVGASCCWTSRVLIILPLTVAAVLRRGTGAAMRGVARTVVA